MFAAFVALVAGFPGGGLRRLAGRAAAAVDLLDLAVALIALGVGLYDFRLGLIALGTMLGGLYYLGSKDARPTDQPRR